jgi:hypothetical protein
MAKDKLDVQVLKKTKRLFYRFRELSRFWRYIISGICFILGLVSLVLPIIPSWVLILVSFALIHRSAWRFFENVYVRYIRWRQGKNNSDQK